MCCRGLWHANMFKRIFGPWRMLLNLAVVPLAVALVITANNFTLAIPPARLKTFYGGSGEGQIFSADYRLAHWALYCRSWTPICHHSCRKYNSIFCRKQRMHCVQYLKSSAMPWNSISSSNRVGMMMSKLKSTKGILKPSHFTTSTAKVSVSALSHFSLQRIMFDLENSTCWINIAAMDWEPEF